MRAVASAVALLAAALSAQAPRDPLVLRADTVLEKGKVYGPIVIEKDGITVDGRGAQVVGADPFKRQGVGVSATGVSGVTVRGLTIKGFAVGLQIERGAHWTVSDCDVSDNFTDPEFGWGEQPDRGGIVCRSLSDSAIERTKGNRNWDGCSLVDCRAIAITGCQFAHCSNTALKLWHASDNRIADCDLSWGLRIKPGETHARDSTCVLIESGSDRNRFVRDDCTHGGDGVFIRVLNNWTSRGNVFEAVDASYANNNAFESWSPENTYRDCKANHSSYGFWLGGSDKTLLIDNEAAFNGDPKGFHNAPEGFGHAGIVFYGGSSSHSVAQGNWCHDNFGGGIVIAGDVGSAGKTWRAFHWVLQQNRLERNRYGMHLQFADWLDLAGNSFAGNGDGDVFDAGGVTRLRTLAPSAAVKAPPVARLVPVTGLRVGESAAFDASGSTDPQHLPLAFHWDLGDGTRSEEAKVMHAYAAPGFYRAGVTVDNGSLAALAFVDVYVVDAVDLAADPQAWDFTDNTKTCRVAFTADTEQRLVGPSSVRAHIDPYDGQRVSLLWPKGRDAGVDLAGKKQLVFWLRAIDPFVPAWQDVNPLVTLWESSDRSVVLQPRHDLLSAPPNSEGRDGWNRFVVPLAGDELWQRRGADLQSVNWITLGFDSWGAPPLTIWVDGLGWQ